MLPEHAKESSGGGFFCFEYFTLYIMIVYHNKVRTCLSVYFSYNDIHEGQKCLSANIILQGGMNDHG